MFHGSISGDERESRIDGKFSTFRRTQVFCGVWFGFLALFTLLLLPTVIGSVAPLGMMALGTGLVAIGQHLSRGEKEKILSALSGIQNSNPLQSGGITTTPGKGMKIVASILALLGVGNLVGFITAIAKAGFTGALLADLIPGLLAFLVAWGILKRKRYAWVLGFVLIVISAVSFPVRVIQTTPTQSGTDHFVLLAFSTLGALAVAIYWAVLWRAQRDYFHAKE